MIESPEVDRDLSSFRKVIIDSGATDIDLASIGNALASFIATKVSQCTSTAWEQYLEGDETALSDEQVKGALLFFGKGCCAGCHSVSSFNDFSFHSIGVPQGDFGPHIHGQDIGRASVTLLDADRFLFRTPPLLRVSKTAPYSHNGLFSTLQ